MAQLDITIPTQQAAQSAATIRQLMDQIKASAVDLASTMTRLGTQMADALGLMRQAGMQVQQGQAATMGSTNQLAAATLALAQATTMQTKVYAETQAAAATYRREQDAVRESLHQAREEAGRAGDVLRQVFAVAGGIGLATSIQSVVGSLKNFATESVNVAVKLQSLEATFKVLSGSSKGAQSDLTFLRETSNRLGVDFLAAAQSFKGLEAATRGTALEGQKARDIFVAFAEAGRVLGLSSEELRHVLIAVEQMLSKGKVSAEELRRQMGNFLPGAFEIAARSIGVTTKELDSMLKSGQLISEDFVPKFAAQIRRELGQGVPDAAATASASFTKFANNMRDISRTVGDAILVILKPILDTINLAFDKVKEAQTEAAQRRNVGVGDPRTPLQSVEGRDLQGMIASIGGQLTQAQEALRRLNDLNADAIRGPADPQALETAQVRVRALTKEYAALTEQAGRFRQQQAGTGEGEGFLAKDVLPFQRQAEAIKTDLKEMQKDLAAIDIAARRFMPKEALDIARENLRAMDTYLGKIADTIASSPGMDKFLPKGLETTLAGLKTQRDAAAERVDVLEAQEKASKDAERAAAKDARDIEKDFTEQRQERWKQLDIFGLLLAPEQEEALKTQAKDQHDRIKAFAEELDIFGLNLAPEQVAQREAIQKSTEVLRRYQEQLELSGGALDAFGRASKITPQARAVTRAERDLAPLEGTALATQASQVIDLQRKAALEATPLFKGLTKASDEFADSFLRTIEEASQGGIKSFKSFADSVIQQLFRIASQQYLQPALSGLIKQGLTAVAGLFGPSPGASDADFTGAGATVPLGQGQAAGGPVYGGHAYPVGEVGPELFIPAMNGRILSHADAMAAWSEQDGQNESQGQTIIQVGGIHVHGVQSAETFLRSQGQLSKAALQIFDQAQRSR